MAVLFCGRAIRSLAARAGHDARLGIVTPKGDAVDPAGMAESIRRGPREMRG